MTTAVKFNTDKAIVQYVRKYKKIVNGKTVEQGPGKKVAVLVASKNEHNDNQVIIGFSLTHKNDRYDYVCGKYKKGHGINIASKRAEKWHGAVDVAIPHSIKKEIKAFIKRCQTYYKDAVVYPAWTEILNYEGDQIKCLSQNT